MKSPRRGRNISEAEVQGVSARGFWLYARGREYFLSFQNHPWFKDAKVADICNVELHRRDHLHWPALDVDLELDALQRPENYPLIYKEKVVSHV
jgi:hypothetical protein